jgi:hypothetical protein
MRAWLFSLASLALGMAVPATAQNSQLPTSSAEMTGTWRVMNPTTFQLSHAAILNQYDRVAAVDARMTAEKRTLLERMLASGGGREVWVPDGVDLDYLTGRRQGQPHVYERMEKQIGRTDRAILFDLGDGVSLYWFTGTRESCNNIGIVINEPRPSEPLVVTVTQYMYVLMPQEDHEVFRGQGYIPSLYLAACCNNPGGVCSSLYLSGMLFEPGSVHSTPTLVRVRVPRPQS